LKRAPERADLEQGIVELEMKRKQRFSGAKE
jgi:hypothetical protein